MFLIDRLQSFLFKNVLIFRPFGACLVWQVGGEGGGGTGPMRPLLVMLNERPEVIRKREICCCRRASSDTSIDRKQPSVFQHKYCKSPSKPLNLKRRHSAFQNCTRAKLEKQIITPLPTDCEDALEWNGCVHRFVSFLSKTLTEASKADYSELLSRSPEIFVKTDYLYHLHRCLFIV